MGGGRSVADAAHDPKPICILASTAEVSSSYSPSRRLPLHENEANEGIARPWWVADDDSSAI